MKTTNICCIGAGHVGGPTMAVFALKCPTIRINVVDSNPAIIDAWNSSNLDDLPVYEPKLKEIITKTRGKNLFFNNDIHQAINQAQIIFIAVNTPTKTFGLGKGFAADLTNIEHCAREIGAVATSDKIIVEKSTVPVKTAEVLDKILSSINETVHFEILSNPEFLSEGNAIEELIHPDRVLIGASESPSGQKALQTLIDIYKQWVPETRILTNKIWSSELSKLAANAMLAQRISSINSLSALCEETNADINEIAHAIGKDTRIGPKFLRASIGFGGSCFKKDILNLVYLCQQYNLNEVATYWHQVLKLNDYQTNRFFKIILRELNGTINEKKIGLLGWAYKQNTNDSRESPAIYIADALIEEGAKITVYDPAVKAFRINQDLINLWKNRGEKDKQIEKKIKRVETVKKVELATHKASALAILTNWDVFKHYDWNRLTSTMEAPITIFDGVDVIDNLTTGHLYKIGVSAVSQPH